MVYWLRYSGRYTFPFFTMSLRFLLFSVAASVTLFVSAQPRSLSAARQIAAGKINVQAAELVQLSHSSQSIQKALAGFDLGGTPFYVFNQKDGHAFVIVSADSRMRPVLGCCDNVAFSADSIPCGLSYLLSHYAEQYAFMEQLGDMMAADDGQDQDSYPDVEPLITSEWGQDSPYNDDCPSGCPSGCVATAMAQVMKYYGYPASGQGSFSYTSATRHYSESYDFGNATFDWDNMRDEYSATSSFGSESSRAAVANLMKACGVSVGMDYAPGGSGAYDCDIAYALINFFAYNKNTVLYERTYFKSAEWYEKMHEELSASRPVLYCGQDRYNNGGHAFVIDGYRQSDGKFHVNWGWDGYYNGYYELDALDPQGYSFSTSQSMIARFCPETTGDGEDTFYADDFSYTGMIDAGSTVNFSITGAVNYSNSSSYVVTSSSFSGTIGVGLFDSDFHFVQSMAEKDVVNLRSAFSPASVLRLTAVIPSSLPDADQLYYIAPFAKASGSDTPTRIRTTGGMTDYYVLNASGTSPDDPDPDNPEGDTVLHESFEDYSIPDGWEQQLVLGASNWQTRLVLYGDDDSESPNPSSGNGYAYLNYNSGTAFADIRTVTRLITPTLQATGAHEYLLNCKYRKYASQVNSVSVLSVFINRGESDDWEALTELTITSSNMWQSLSLSFSADEPYRLAFEGSIEDGSIVFLDDIEVIVPSETGVTTVIDQENGNARCQTYTLSGVPVRQPSNGIYIVRRGLTTRKYLFK